jgi:hypothetical protein
MDMQFYEGQGAGGMAIKFIGGEYLHRDHRGDPNARPPMVPVSAAKQREALRFVCDEFLSGRYFGFEPDQLQKLAPDFWVDDFFTLFFGGHNYPYLENVLWVQSSLVYGLTSPDRLNRVVDARHKTKEGADILTAPEIFDAVQGTVFNDLATLHTRKGTNQAPVLDDMQRNLQREYVSHLIWILLEGEGWYSPTVQTLARHYVKRLGDEIQVVLRNATEFDTYTRAHLEECHAKLTRALEASYTLR